MTPAETALDVRVGQMRNLGLATLAFAMTFWAWNLIARSGCATPSSSGSAPARRHCWLPRRSSSVPWAGSSPAPWPTASAVV